MAADTSLSAVANFPAVSTKITLSSTAWKRVNLPDGASHVTIKAETGSGTIRGYVAFEGAGIADGATVTHASDRRLDVDLAAGPTFRLSVYSRATFILLASHTGTPDVSVLIEREPKQYE
jgi:hypothetical protein